MCCPERVAGERSGKSGGGCRPQLLLRLLVLSSTQSWRRGSESSLVMSCRCCSFYVVIISMTMQLFLQDIYAESTEIMYAHIRQRNSYIIVLIANEMT